MAFGHRSLQAVDLPLYLFFHHIIPWTGHSVADVWGGAPATPLCLTETHTAEPQAESGQRANPGEPLREGSSFIFPLWPATVSMKQN